MIKTTFPSTNKSSIVLPLPDEYRGRDIEVLLYAKDELQVNVQSVEQKKKPVTMADFIGTISKEDAAQLRLHTENARKEWDRDF